jgi:glycerol uptake facilitator protein
MASHRWCPAHLNPAVTLAMCIARHHTWRRLLPYSIVQLLGSILAGLALLFLFESSIHRFEKDSLGLDANLYELAVDAHDGYTAQMFGEFFPNPGYADVIEISWPMAMLAEGLGAFLLLTFIFWIIKDIHRMAWKPAILIGLTVALLICVFAPFTQCGMNPARDLGPRLVAYFGGWGEAALPSPSHAAISVYVIGPLIGAALAAWIQKKK